MANVVPGEGVSSAGVSGGGGTPSGAAGGVLAGTYPNPTLAATIAQRITTSAGFAATGTAGAGTGYQFGPNTNQELYWNGAGSYFIHVDSSNYLQFFNNASVPAVGFGVAGNAWICAGGAAGFLELNKGTQGTVTGTRLDLETVKYAPVTVATLPTGVFGMVAAVTDGTAALAWGATLTGGGGETTNYIVWFNGANWTVMGK